eukprot:SAG25_NODE_177_length_12713_cov_474.755272_3_plen_392_part_00
MHSVTLHTHARHHPSRTRASSQPQSAAHGWSKGCASSGGKLGRERWRGQHAATRPSAAEFPLFSPLASAWSKPVSPCPPRRSRNRAATHRGHTWFAVARHWPPQTPGTAAVRGGSKGGTLLQMRGICKWGGACHLDVRTCAPRGHPVVSVAAAQSSALAGGRRASAARRENLLRRGWRQPPPKNLVGMRRHLTLRPLPAAGGQVREEWPLRCIWGGSRRLVGWWPVPGLGRRLTSAAGECRCGGGPRSARKGRLSQGATSQAGGAVTTKPLIVEVWPRWTGGEQQAQTSHCRIRSSSEFLCPSEGSRSTVRPPIFVISTYSTVPQWIAKQQLDRQGTKCFWRGPVGQQKSAQRHEGTNVPSCGVLAGTEDDRLRLSIDLVQLYGSTRIMIP